MVIHNKLVRDKIISIIDNNGKKSHYRILDDDEYDIELKKKLLEEAQEVYNASNKDELIKELADVLEVIDTIISNNHISIKDIYDIKDSKAISNGKFNDRIFLEYVED